MDNNTETSETDGTIDLAKACIVWWEENFDVTEENYRDGVWGTHRFYESAPDFVTIAKMLIEDRSNG